MNNIYAKTFCKKKNSTPHESHPIISARGFGGALEAPSPNEVWG